MSVQATNSDKLTVLIIAVILDKFPPNLKSVCLAAAGTNNQLDMAKNAFAKIGGNDFFNPLFKAQQIACAQVIIDKLSIFAAGKIFK